MYQYRPQNEDELELREGDRVDVMQQCDDGWFVGMWPVEGRAGQKEESQGLPGDLSGSAESVKTHSQHPHLPSVPKRGTPPAPKTVSACAQ